MRMTIVLKALVKGERIKKHSKHINFYLKLKYIAGVSSTKNVRKVNIILFVLFEVFFLNLFLIEIYFGYKY